MKRQAPVNFGREKNARLVALAALIAGLSRPNAAKAAKVSGRTLDRWRAEAGFAAELEAGRRAAFGDALGGLKGSALRAVETLAALLNSKHEAERRHAAAEILGFAFKAFEAGELEARVSELEKRAYANTAGARIGPN